MSSSLAHGSASSHVASSETSSPLSSELPASAASAAPPSTATAQPQHPTASTALPPYTANDQRAWPALGLDTATLNLSNTLSTDSLPLIGVMALFATANKVLFDALLAALESTRAYPDILAQLVAKIVRLPAFTAMAEAFARSDVGLFAAAELKRGHVLAPSPFFRLEFATINRIIGGGLADAVALNSQLSEALPPFMARADLPWERHSDPHVLRALLCCALRTNLFVSVRRRRTDENGVVTFPVARVGYTHDGSTPPTGAYPTNVARIDRADGSHVSMFEVARLFTSSTAETVESILAATAPRKAQPTLPSSSELITYISTIPPAQLKTACQPLVHDIATRGFFVRKSSLSVTVPGAPAGGSSYAQVTRVVRSGAFSSGGTSSLASATTTASIVPAKLSAAASSALSFITSLSSLAASGVAPAFVRHSDGSSSVTLEGPARALDDLAALSISVSSVMPPNVTRTSTSIDRSAPIARTTLVISLAPPPGPPAPQQTAATPCEPPTAPVATPSDLVAAAAQVLISPRPASDTTTTHQPTPLAGPIGHTAPAAVVMSAHSSLFPSFPHLPLATPSAKDTVLLKMLRGAHIKLLKRAPPRSNGSDVFSAASAALGSVEEGDEPVQTPQPTTGGKAAAPAAGAAAAAAAVVEAEAAAAAAAFPEGAAANAAAVAADATAASPATAGAVAAAVEAAAAVTVDAEAAAAAAAATPAPAEADTTAAVEASAGEEAAAVAAAATPAPAVADAAVAAEVTAGEEAAAAAVVAAAASPVPAVADATAAAAAATAAAVAAPTPAPIPAHIVTLPPLVSPFTTPVAWGDLHIDSPVPAPPPASPPSPWASTSSAPRPSSPSPPPPRGSSPRTVEGMGALAPTKMAPVLTNPSSPTSSTPPPPPQ